MSKYILLSIILLIGFCQNSSAQQRFKGGIVLGVNAAQINGDLSAGFNKLGLMGGLKSAAILGEKTELGIELLFSQRGSQSSFFTNQNVAPSRIHLNYVEVPLTFTFKDWQSEGEENYRMHFHGGLSYGRLIDARSDDAAIIVNEFNNNDFAVLVGVTYFVNTNFGLSFRYNRSVIPLFNREKATNPINADTLWSFFLTFNGVYMF